MTTILIIEDQQDNRDIYERWLLREGYKLLYARDGIEGVSLAQHHRPDLVLMDILMPYLNGWNTTRQLRLGAQTRHIPIIAVSAIPEDEGRGQSLAVGCDDFFAKPVNFPALLVRIKELLNKSKDK